MIIKLWRTQRGPERTLNLINNNSTETKKKQKESGFLSRIEGYGVKVFECEGKHYGYTGDIQSGWIPDPGFVKHWNVFQKLVSISKLVTFSVSSFEGKNTLAWGDVKATFPWDWDLASWCFRVLQLWPSWDPASRNTGGLAGTGCRPCSSPHHSMDRDYRHPQLCQEQIFLFFLFSLAWSPVSHKCN